METRKRSFGTLRNQILFPHMSNQKQNLTDNQRSADSQNSTDTQLITKIAQHNLRAFEQFYERHAEIVYGLILYIVQDRGLADELLQETFLQVWSQADSIEPDRNAALWLYQSARRRCLDALRWSLRNPQQQAELIERIRQQAQMLSRNNGSYDLSATVLVDFTNEAVQSQRDLAWQVFQGMPEEQRVCLSLAFFAGMSDEEIANYLQTSPVRVQAHIQEGIGKFNRLAHPRQEVRREWV